MIAHAPMVYVPPLPRWHLRTALGEVLDCPRYVGRRVLLSRGSAVVRGIVARCWRARRNLTREGVTFATGHVTRLLVVSLDGAVIRVRAGSGWRVVEVEEVRDAS